MVLKYETLSYMLTDTCVETLGGYALGLPHAQLCTCACLIFLWAPSTSFSLDENTKTLLACTIGCGLAGDTGQVAIVYDFQSKWPRRVSLRMPNQEEEKRVLTGY